MGQTRYLLKIWVLKSHFSFKVRQHGQQQLYFQYKVWWILNIMIGAPSFSQRYLRIQPMLQYPAKNSSPTSVNFHLPIPLLLVHKIILAIPTNTPFLYSSAIFHLPLFVYNLPNNLHQKVWTSSQSMNSENRLTITDYLLLRLWNLVCCRCGKPSNPPFLNLLSLLSYPNNTTARTHIPLETSCLNWFSS